MGLPVIDLRLSQLDAVDLRGLPRVEDGQTTWCPPDFLPAAGTGEGILFLDELNQADRSVQAAAYQLILDRRVGNYELPPGWTIIAAGNRLSDAALANPLSSALKNRMAHIDIETPLEDWVEWALQHDIHEAVVAFLKFRPELLNTFDPTKREVSSFATPRSWTFLSRLLLAAGPHASPYPLAASTVGEAVATEFAAFIAIYKDLLTYEEIVENPDRTPPTELATLYALTTMLAYRVKKEDFPKVYRFLIRLPVEFQTAFFKDAVKRNPELLMATEFAEWSKQNAELLF
jgi:MoxR-like ATPase